MPWGHFLTGLAQTLIALTVAFFALVVLIAIIKAADKDDK